MSLWPYGNKAWQHMMPCKGLTGSGWRWTGRGPKPRLGGEKVGKNPTDRGKIGTKRSLLTDGRGVPIGLAVDGANRNDCKLTRETIERIAVERPEAPPDAPQGRCLDKGYDDDEGRDLLDEFGFTAHIRARGEEAQALKHEAGFKARRWVVERTHSWMNRFRRVLIRWDKKACHYMAFLHLACAYITYRQAGLLG